MQQSKSEIQKGFDLSIQIDDITVSYNDAGEGKMPVIFIHGFPFDKTSWQPQLDHLKKNNRVISYDIRGFGKSSVGNNKQSINLFSDDLIRFMDALNIDKAIVGGLSMGGYILLNAMSRFPERFEAMMLCDTQCIADSPEAKEKRALTIESVNSNGLGSFAEGFVKNIFCSESLENKNALVENIKNTILSTPKEVVTGTLNALAQRSETCSGLGKIAVPVLILCGTEDKVTPLAQSEYLHANISNSTLHSIERAGHLSNLEQPDSFNRHVEDFISALTQ